MRFRRINSGFTLVELLVVIAIISVLIALILPALGRTRETARGVQCLSNLHQLVISANTYVKEYRGYYPPAYWSVTNGNQTISYAWDLTTITQIGHPTRVIPGLLWDSRGTTKIQQCPSFDGKANWLVDPYTGYNYNTSYIGHGQQESIPAPTKAAKVRSPATTALFGDGEWRAGANKFMRAPFPNPGDASFAGRWAGTQGFRHRNATNIAFCDGHAETLKDRFIDNADGAGNVARRTGFISRDNSLYDLK